MSKQQLVGTTYHLGNIAFQVLKTDPYPKSRVAKWYREILSFPPGVLVAVPYRGILIPNITTTDGVMRLIKVEVVGIVYSSPKAISEALGVKQSMHQYCISRQ